MVFDTKHASPDVMQSRPKKAKKDSLTALLSKKDPWDGD